MTAAQSTAQTRRFARPGDAERGENVAALIAGCVIIAHIDASWRMLLRRGTLRRLRDVLQRGLNKLRRESGRRLDAVLREP